MSGHFYAASARYGNVKIEYVSSVIIESKWYDTGGRNEEYLTAKLVLYSAQETPGCKGLPEDRTTASPYLGICPRKDRETAEIKATIHIDIANMFAS